MPPTPQPIYDNQQTKVIRALLEQRDEIEERLEDAYARADAADLMVTEARDALRPLAHHARPGDDFLSEQIREPKILERHIVAAAMILQQEGQERGEAILELFHDMYRYVGHGNYCNCDRDGQPCEIDAIRTRYKALFPLPKSDEGTS